MKRLFKRTMAVLLCVLMTTSFTAFPVSAYAKEKNTGKNYVEGEVIAVLEDGAGRNMLYSSSAYGSGMRLKARHTYKSKNKDELNIGVLKSNSLSTQAMIRKLKNNPKVKYAFPNYKLHKTDITNDTYSKYQWALKNNGQNGGTPGDDVKADALWDKASSSKKEQIVAVIDTGIDFENEELKDKIWTNPYGSKLVGKHGYDFSGTNKDGEPRDGDGHGTHCAGIIAAAADNSKGVSGINKSNVKIMPVKWLNDSGTGDTASVLAAYDYVSRAIDLGANVVAINNSWGGEGDADDLKTFNEIFDTLGEKGAISLVAAGNDGNDISEHDISESISSILPGIIIGGDDTEQYTIPACTSSSYALTVAATNEKDELADFSNYSKDEVDIAAPGADILSTVSEPCFNPSIYSAEKKKKLVQDFQDFDGNGTFSERDFGYPTVVKPNDDKKMAGTDKVSFKITDGGFGVKAGKRLSVTLNDNIKKGRSKTFAFEIPFKVEDENEEYTVSFMDSGLKDSVAAVYDVPRNTEISDIDSDYSPSTTIMGSENANYWTHDFFTSNSVDSDGYPDDPDYDQAKERKLVFLCIATQDGTSINIDDLAISKQNIDEKEFEKYDFYCGTSMATPYAAGAVALLKNADNSLSAYDIINILKHTGRDSESLKGKTESGKVLSLDNISQTPPMIFSAGYNDSKKVELKGSFKNITSVEVDGKIVKPSSSSASKIVIPDNNYNTKKVTIKLKNAYGSDSKTVLLSNKNVYPSAGIEVVGEPSSVSGGVMLPANDELYYVNDKGAVGRISYSDDDMAYSYDESSLSIDYKKVFPTGSTSNCSVVSAVYTNSYIYFIAQRSITASNQTVIGADTVFASLNIKNNTTAKLCDIPDESVQGGSLGAYNGSVYLAGGYDNGKFITSVYKYNSSKKRFDKVTASLPEGRAYTKFIQYENRLIGVYGAQKDKKMPNVIAFDGKKWTKSKISFNSEDFYEYEFPDGNAVNVFEGNLGYGSGGVFCVGAYVYGRGDSFTYNPNKDTITNFAYTAKNSLDDSAVIGSTLPGCFIGFKEDDSDELSIDDLKLFKRTSATDLIDWLLDDDNDDLKNIDLGASSALKVNLSTSYAKVTSSVKGAKLKGVKSAYNYGEKVKLTLAPSKGYIVTGISVNGKLVSQNSNSATVTLNSANNKLTASLKYLVPPQVKSLKVKAGSKKADLSWKKTKNTTGYQVQVYENKKWKTKATIKSAKTLKYTVKGLKKKSYSFRVRSYYTYKGKTYYGKWSKAVKVKIK